MKSPRSNTTTTQQPPPPRHHHYDEFPTKRSQHTIDTETTDAQTTAEMECAPFFVDLRSLPRGQLDHLRGVGLLPPLPPPSSASTRTGSGTGRGGVGGTGITGNEERMSEKAAKILGVEQNNTGIDDSSATNGERIVILEEIQTDTTSPLESENDSPDTSSVYAIRLLRAQHTSYLTKSLCDPLSRGFVSLDASHPWMVYWIMHSLDLLGYFDLDLDLDDNHECASRSAEDGVKEMELLQKGQLLQRVVSTLSHCWTDVPLEFNAKEVECDDRLKQLLLSNRNSKNGSDTCTSGRNSGTSQSNNICIIGGGFGGGPSQMPHCAPTYAAVLALSIVASIGNGTSSSSSSSSSDEKMQQHHHHPFHKAGEMAMQLLKRRRLQLYAFFLSLRELEQNDSDGDNNSEYGDDDHDRMAFRMQHDGEIDVRASYCILAPCHLLGLVHVKPHRNSNSSNDAGIINPLLSPAISRHIASCQTFEGGFGAEPFNEAHGGYTFCALAALRILNAVSMIDVEALQSWLAKRQMGFEGGFSGRTNKLVDGCYSFWQGGAVAVLDAWYYDEKEEDSEDDSDDQHNDEGGQNKKEISFDEVMLQRYILLCAQDVNGGLRDKPSKPRDFYHSCYNLSGLSVAQHALQSWPPVIAPANNDNVDDATDKACPLNRIFGDGSFNIIGKTDPVLNIRVERVKFMLSQSF